MDLSQRIAKLSPEQRAQLDARLRKHREAPMSGTDRIEKRPATAACALSFAQERLWFLEQLEGTSATYNIYSATRFRGPLRVDCLEQALAEIVRRHESLRTTFPVLAPNEPPVQKVAETSVFRLEVVDLSPNSGNRTESALRQLVNEFVRQPMRLARGPLFRAQLLRVAADDHVLTVVMHHIISDGWSLDVFFRELSTLYDDFVTDRKSSLPPLGVQFADFALWQRQRLQGDVLKRHLDYWRDRLAGDLPVLELPGNISRPAEQTYHGADCERQIGAGLTERIHRMSRETEGTVFMTVLAAFTALLHRYSGRTSIQVGSPVTNRNRVELEPLIGFFVNMLVLRTNVSGELTVRELIQQVRQVTLEALSNQELPFEILVRELQPQRSLSHPPLFQVALMFEEAGRRWPQLSGLTSEPIPVNTGTAKFDLTLFVSESPDGMRLGLEYATDLFTAETAERILAHLECVLEGFVTDPDSRISQLHLLTPAEKRQLLVEWNRTEAAYPRDKTIQALFEEQAQRTPDSTAVEFGRDHLTYRELDHRAALLALELQRLGVSANVRVGVYVERSVDMVVGVLGILKAGGAYVPLDPSFPRDRLSFVVADAQISVLVTQQRLVSELPEHQGQVVCVDALPDANKQASPLSPRTSVSSENLAYVIYTSGSTGRPKGVQIPHRAVVNFLYSMRQSPGLLAEDIWLAVTTLSFDIAGLELFLPLSTGAKVVIAPREVTVDGPHLARLLKDSKATVMQATPATWRMLIEAGWRGDNHLKILCGGEAIDRELAERLLERCGELWNMYGPTETTIWSTTERLLPGHAITIGRPIANTTLYILDENFQPVPVGVVGELFIGGDGVACGYLNRPELTGERFVSDPFDSRRTGKLYRTGDLARFRSDGKIEFLGRKDQQVKIRGFRIELGEIEAALARQEGVVQAAVVAREDTPGDKRLVAYLVANGLKPALHPGPRPVTMDSPNDTDISGNNGSISSHLNLASLRAALRETLPDYMIPSAFVVLEALPLTPNGKVDRKALPSPEHLGVDSIEAYEAPQGESETKLAAIMASILKAPRVGRKDSFFEIGGHSILAVTLFNEIERVFGKRLPLATLFRAPTVEQLAPLLETKRDQQGNWASLVAIQPGGSKPRFFCVHGGGGNVLLYRDLARNFGADYPFYGLQSQGLDGKMPPLGTVEEMAEKYCREILELQPTGPFCLGGYCLGGTIAIELAQRLRRAGHQVPLVALFDTYNFSQMDQPTLWQYLRQKIAFHLSTLFQLRLRNWPGYFHNKLRVARDGELASLWNSFLTSIRKEPIGKAGSSIELSVQEVNDRAAAAYRPKPYDGRVTVFKPRVNYDFYPDPQMGWGEVAVGGVEVVELSANPHAMLVEPFVYELARELRRRLDLVSCVLMACLVECSSKMAFTFV